MTDERRFTYTVYARTNDGEDVLLGSGVMMRSGRLAINEAVESGLYVGGWMVEDYPNHRVAYRKGETGGV